MFSLRMLLLSRTTAKRNKLIKALMIGQLVSKTSAKLLIQLQKLPKTSNNSTLSNQLKISKNSILPFKRPFRTALNPQRNFKAQTIGHNALKILAKLLKLLEKFLMISRNSISFLLSKISKIYTTQYNKPLKIAPNRNQNQLKITIGQLAFKISLKLLLL